MDAITEGFLKQGLLGLVIAALIAVLSMLWKCLGAEREKHATRMKEVQEQHSKEREVFYESAKELHDETTTRVYELTRDVTKTTERVSAVVEENTKAIQQWGARVDAMGEKILVLGERVEKLEDR